MFVTPAYAEDATQAKGTTATQSETGAEGHHGGVFPPFDQKTYSSQLLWLVITFGVFYLLISKVIVPRIGGIIDDRNAKIRQDLDTAAKMKADADQAVAAYEKDLADAKAKGQAIATEARDKAKAKADAERAALEANLAAKLTEAETRIAGIREKAFAEVGTIATDTATAIVEQLTGSAASASDVAGVVASLKQEG